MLQENHTLCTLGTLGVTTFHMQELFAVDNRRAKLVQCYLQAIIINSKVGKHTMLLQGFGLSHMLLPHFVTIS